MRANPGWTVTGFSLATAVLAGFVGTGSFALETFLVTASVGLLLALSVRLGGRTPRPPAPDESAGAVGSIGSPGVTTVARPLPPELEFPKPLSTFRGRRAELDQLIAIHDEQRGGGDTTPEQSRTRPVIVCVNGMPGVGKTELAKELARRLKGLYPDGCLSMNFGKAAEPRPSAEILKEMLTRLRWPEADIPPDADGRRTLLRTLTKGRRMVFIFDAARSHDQVSKVMPAEPQCAIIITSRRHLAAALELPPSSAIQLNVPSADDALEMLSAVGGIDWMADADAATEVVELCGRLPLAIRSAGSRISEERTPLRNVVALLRPRPTRLERLEERSGRTVVEGIRTEFYRLSDDEQKALCRLSLVQSRTFIPWVLRPLMDLTEHQAERAMTALEDAQLVQQAARDRATDLRRYEFNPLVRLFAEAQLAKLPNQHEHDAADKQLSDGYREFVRVVLRSLDRSYRSDRGWQWVATTGRPHVRVARRPEASARLEYRNLVRLVLATAEDRDTAMCWRVAARLQGSVPEDPQLKASLQAFEVGRAAAMADGDDIGALDVALAEASLLIAVEQYPEALHQLADISARAQELAQNGDGTRAALRRAKTHRLGAAAALQMGSYARARDELAAARTFIDPAVHRDEWRLLNLLQAEIDRFTDPASARERATMDDLAQYRADLDASEAARRRDSWKDAHAHLNNAFDQSVGDLRRSATVLYRKARLYVEQFHDTPRDRRKRARDDDSPVQLARRAVSHAAQAVVAFRAMGNQVGVIRAQCLQVRALVIAGKLIEAERLLDAVKQDLDRHLAGGCPSGRPLEARYHRARGEWLLQDDITVSAARGALKHAAMIFRETEDWSNHDDVWRVLRQLSVPEHPATGSTEFEWDHLVDATAWPPSRVL